MKGARKFIALMVLLFVGLFVLQMRLPKKFVWNPTFHHADKQPFGCYVFDSVLAQSMPSGYQVNRQSFLQINEEHKGKKVSVLAIMDSQDFSATDVNQLLAIANRGGKVMLVSNGMDENLGKNLAVGMYSYSVFSLNFLVRSIKRGDAAYDTLSWRLCDTVYTVSRFRVYSELIGSFVKVDSVPKFTGIVYDKDGNTIAASIPYGKGEVILVSTPLLFTNYGMLTGNISEYIFRLMSQIADLPVIRTEAYMQTDAMIEARQSPLREFIKRPALRSAIYLMMLGVVLFMIFTARRRQRVIPVMKRPKNYSLEFIQLIGTLYYQRKDHTDLVRKKFRYFAEEVRRSAGIDIADVNGDDAEFRLLADKTGLEREYLRKMIREIRLVLHSENNIPSSQMRGLIDVMNEIIAKL